jgi:hypothetical protein
MPPPSTARPELSRSLDDLRRAAQSLKDESNRLAVGLRGRDELLRRPAAPPTPEPRPRAAQEATVSVTRGAFARPREDPAVGPPLGASVAAALVPLASFALLDVSLAMAAAVALVGSVLLQVRWWMLGVSAIGLAGALALEPSLRDGDLADKVTGLLLIFLVMSIALLLQEVWERLRAARA